MSVTSRSPLRMAGATVNSGNVNTGELPTTQGGMQKWAFNSGGALSPGSGSPNPPAGTVVKTGDHVLVFSGAGRLNRVLPHQVISGVALVLYDSAVVARSGPNTHVESGYAVLGVVPANSIGAFGNSLGGGPLPIDFGTPFHSGLCVLATSGTPGATITFSPETNLANPG